MNFSLKKLETFVIIVIISVIGIIYAFTQKSAQTPIQTNTSLDQTVKQDEKTSRIRYQGVNGKNALELLEAYYRVETKHFVFGDMIVGIDGVTPDTKHFWAFYVNDTLSQVGAETYITKSTDRIEWKLEEIKN